ncbi:hypothetical protein J6590_031528 [Homalodisca vitripennis]|nr:hypothetical protein J6590_031528 [Homalodisca vitripennis]
MSYITKALYNSFTALVSQHERETRLRPTAEPLECGGTPGGHPAQALDLGYSSAVTVKLITKEQWSIIAQDVVKVESKPHTAKKK